MRRARPPRARQRRSFLSLESLEERNLPSIWLDGAGALHVACDSAVEQQGYNQVQISGGSSGIWAWIIDGRGTVEDFAEYDPSVVTSISAGSSLGGHDAFNIIGTVASAPVTLESGSADNAVYIAPDTNNMNDIQGNISLTGSGWVWMVLNDFQAPSAVTCQVTSSQVSRGGAANISYSNVGELVYYGNNQGDTYNVQSTASGTLTLIYYHGVNTFNVGNAGSVQGIQGNLVLGNLNSGDTAAINVDASADSTASQAVAITNTGITGLCAGTIRYNQTGIARLTLKGGRGGTTYYVESTPNDSQNPGESNTILTCGGGGDLVMVGNNGNLAGIQGTLYVNGAATSSFNLYVIDYSDTTSHTVYIGGGITGLAPAPIEFDSSYLQYLQIDSGLSSNSWHVDGTPNNAYGMQVGKPEVITQIISQAQDTVFVGADSGSLRAILGNLSVTNLSTLTYLYVEDYADTSYHSATISDTAVTGLAQGAIYYQASELATLMVDGGTGGDQFLVTNTPKNSNNLGTYLYLYGGGGVNIQRTSGPLYVWSAGNAGITVGSNAPGLGGTLANIQGNIQISGASNARVSLFVDEAGVSTATGVTLGPGSVTGWWPAGIYWTPGQLSYLAFYGGSGGNYLSVTGTGAATTYISGGSGNDQVNVQAVAAGEVLSIDGNGGSDLVTLDSLAPHPGGTLANIAGTVYVADTYGHAALLLDDSGDAQAKTVIVTSSAVTGLSQGTINYRAGQVSSLTIDGGSGGNTFNVQSLPASPTQLAINGGTGTNTLAGPNMSNTWVVSGSNSGSLDQTVSFSAVQKLVGGTGVDVFKLTAAGKVSSISGGGAPAGQGDWLDYSAFTSPVTVNLTTGAATNVNGSAAGAVTGIQDVRGGNGGNTLTGNTQAKLIGNTQGNILVGGAGNNTITGGSGASLLIGGPGTDTVIGGSGGDILIGGTTAYDANTTALMSILAEWQSSNSYATRISHLKNGGGLNGSNKLVLGSTVFDDGNANQLTGGSPVNIGALDWFFKGVHDHLSNVESGEQIN
jgi:hypothetical protein